MQLMSVRTRIAPSPTGIPHIGTTRTALYNYLFAKKHHGTFILRIEDTDRERFVEGAEEKLYEIFTWLGLVFDENYKQSERLPIYKKHADELLEKDLAYEDNGAIRFRMPKDGKTEWTDGVGDKLISFENKDQEDFIILKSDGYPTYNFAHVIDDHLMEISHVIRGQEFISSTPKHIQIYRAFSWEHPILVHLPLVLGNDHQKLSKRHGAKSALDYRDDGYLSDAVNNYMALLGWNSGDDRELMTVEEMIELFELEGLNSASPVFDPKKLEWMNGEYIRQLSVDELSSKLKVLASQRSGQNSKLGDLDEKIVDKLIELAQSRMKTLNDFYDLTKFILEKSEVELTDQEKIIAKKLLEKLGALETWTTDEILSVLRSVLEENSIKMSVLYKIFTGNPHGLPLPQVLEILGKEKVLGSLQL